MARFFWLQKLVFESFGLSMLRKSFQRGNGRRVESVTEHLNQRYFVLFSLSQFNRRYFQDWKKMSSRYRDSGCPPDCKVYVGDLGNCGTKHEIEDAFSYYGPLRNVWVARNPPGFAFVEFEDSRDARDAVRGLDGKLICGRRVRVELSTGRSRSSFRGPPPRPFHPDDRCYDCGERGHYARDCKRVSKWSRRSRSRSRGAEASPHPEEEPDSELLIPHQNANYPFPHYIPEHNEILYQYISPASFLVVQCILDSVFVRMF
ncbi:hypothetical protein TNCT_586591 [Trichonephila clavata]|uniref:Serine/arginine-rich splicing factor 7 n=1 Tax=Trichonephila clavata TaxID=2740835 RepID=A0A8X6HZW3_TRICU|nr:hypothetical protein TNCT_586591 [Trichonephila clavata]